MERITRSDTEFAYGFSVLKHIPSAMIRSSSAFPYASLHSRQAGAFPRGTFGGSVLGRNERGITWS